MEEYKSYIEVCNKSYDLLRDLIPYQKNIQDRISNSNFFSNVFLMTKYRNYNKNLSQYIIDILRDNNLNGVRADMKNWNLTSDSIFNPLAVLYCCNYGIALFDKPEDGQYYGPNVAYELGMMHLQHKQCLILIHDDIVDKKPFDLLGKMHKVYKGDLDVKELIENWIVENNIKPTEDSKLNSYSIAIGIVKHQGKFLMTKRNKKESNLCWGFPAVQLKPNSDYELLLMNEIKRETNVDVKVILKIGERVPPNIPVFANYYLCEYVDGEIANLDNEENEMVEWVSAEDALTRITSDIYPPLKQILINSK